MGCGGACGGNCSCGTPKVSRRFGLKANDSNIVTAVRALMLEDPAGIAVVLTEQEYERLKAAEPPAAQGGCGCTEGCR